MLATSAQAQALVELFHKGTRLNYKKGEFIIRHGESPSSVFYIESGLVKAYDITKYGEENLLIVRKDKEIFPLIWAITGKERDVVYETLIPTTVWRLDHKTYLNALKNNSDFLLPMLDQVVEMYRLHSERIINLEYRSVRERLVSFLLTMASRFGESTEQGLTVGVPLKQQDIASSINSSRETTSRELTYLEKKGLIENKRICIIIKNKAALEKIL